MATTYFKGNCQARAKAIIYWEYSRVYGNFFVIIEHCTTDTKTFWKNINNYSKLTFICKYNCTIKGLVLNVVLEEKRHGHALSWQAEPYFVEQEAQPTLSPPECWWLERWGISSPASKILEIGLHKSKGSLPSSRAGSFLYLQANTSSYFSSILLSGSSKSSSLLLGLEGHSCAAEWLRFLAST